VGDLLEVRVWEGWMRVGHVIALRGQEWAAERSPRDPRSVDC
jgi:hypothetical protein